MRLAAIFIALAAGSAAAQNPCDECRSTALAKSALCHQAALHPADAVECSVKLQVEREKCQLLACKGEPRARLYALCPDCTKLDGAEKARCEKNFCPPPQPKK
jgi:hypothetical protein